MKVLELSSFLKHAPQHIRTETHQKTNFKSHIGREDGGHTFYTSAIFPLLTLLCVCVSVCVSAYVRRCPPTNSPPSR